jgi:hypothetical protein
MKQEGIPKQKAHTTAVLEDPTTQIERYAMGMMPKVRELLRGKLKERGRNFRGRIPDSELVEMLNDPNTQIEIAIGPPDRVEKGFWITANYAANSIDGKNQFVRHYLDIHISDICSVIEPIEHEVLRYYEALYDAWYFEDYLRKFKHGDSFKKELEIAIQECRAIMSSHLNNFITLSK